MGCRSVMEVLTFGHSTVARGDKTRPRIQKHFPESKNTSQNPKHFPESKTLPRIQKHVTESKTLPRIQKHFPESKSVLDSGTCGGFLEVFLNSGKCFWILGRVWILGSIFRFWEVFLNSGTCFVPTSHRRMAKRQDFHNRSAPQFQKPPLISKRYH